MKPFLSMEHRRIAIYLGSRVQTAQVKFNHLYTSKIDKIISQLDVTKTEAARQLLMKSFQTTDVSELRERIIYAANVTDNSLSAKRRIGEVCKLAIRRAIDTY